MSDRYGELTIESVEQWREWLAAHHASAPGIWLTTYKKDSGRPSVPVGDRRGSRVRLDRQPSPLTGQRSVTAVAHPTPSRQRWSRVNKERVERLIATGRMTPAGIAAIETAKRNGAWTALDAVETLAEPDDLRVALDADPASRRN